MTDPLNPIYNLSTPMTTERYKLLHEEIVAASDPEFPAAPIPDAHALLVETTHTLRTKWPEDDTVKVAFEFLYEMVRSDRRGVKTTARHFQTNLAEWTYQPTHRSLTLRSAIANGHRTLLDIAEDSPSLLAMVREQWEADWEDSRMYAIMGMQSVLEFDACPFTEPPKTCPWTLDQVLNKDYLPE